MEITHSSVRNKPFQPRDLGAVSGSACTGDEEGRDEEMDGSVWSRLPEDLLLSILARLPTQSLARHQAVSRACRDLWRNPSFLQLRSASASPNAWFVFQRKQHPLTSSIRVDCYNTHSNTWHQFRFDHLPQLQRVCAAAGSLLLCVGKMRILRRLRGHPSEIAGRVQPPSYKYLDMVVCNPLKPGSWDRIPDRLGSLVPRVGFMADPHTGDYKVILASLEKTEVYDSRAKSWRLFDNVLSPLHDICSSPVEYRGRLLFLGVGAGGQGKVFVYNLDDNSCTYFDNLFARDPFPRFGYLENCGNRLLMVRVTVSPTEILRSRQLQHKKTFRFERNFQLRVCEYVHRGVDFVDGVWRELTAIPLLELENSVSVNSREGMRFLAAASGAGRQNDLLCFTMGMRDGKLDWTNCVEGRAVFLYSLSQNSWCFVGERPEWTHDGVICMRSLQFLPSLQASVG